MSDEVKTKPLSRKQRIFIDEYLKCFNASEAARRAGYTARPDVIGSQNLAKLSIKSIVDARIAESQMSADEALKLTAQMARGEIPTKRVVTTTETGPVTVNTYEQLDAIDKVLRAHGKFRDNLDMTSGGEKIKSVTVIEIIKSNE